MAEMIVFSQIVEANGKTIRENNLERKHNIPIGTLVEVKYELWHGDGCCEKVHARLWVVMHGRDCDGTPLYSLSEWHDPEFAQSIRRMRGGFSEESLTIVPITQDLKDGYGALEWKGA
jgi:hypothetical protein